MSKQSSNEFFMEQRVKKSFDKLNCHEHTHLRQSDYRVFEFSIPDDTMTLSVIDLHRHNDFLDYLQQIKRVILERKLTPFDDIDTCETIYNPISNKIIIDVWEYNNDESEADESEADELFDD